MISFLLGLSGRLKAVYDYLVANLSTTRAAKIDNLDAAMSTRAAAATALSIAVWTNGTAGKINSGGIPGTVKSIQTGFANSTSTAGAGEDAKYLDVAITAVASTAKCVVLVIPDFYNHFISDTYGGNYQVFPAIRSARLTSTTNLRLSSLLAPSIVGRWTVIEYY